MQQLEFDLGPQNAVENPQLPTLEYFQSITKQTMRELQFPEEQMKGLHCLTYDEFTDKYGFGHWVSIEGDIDHSIGVVFYVEQRVIYGIEVFHGMQSFRKACETVVDLSAD